MKDKKSLIRLDNVVKSFGDNQVLKGVSMELHEGEILAIIGGNGAGKSTLMKIIMGIYHLDAGELYVEGQPMKNQSTANMLQQGVYLVPQEPLLFPNMTVEENVIMGFSGNQKLLKGKLKVMIEQLGWGIDLKRKAATLSIAEQQLVEILRGLMREAKVLILDEPTSTLTFNETKSFFKLMKDLQGKGIGMFYITHRLTEIFEVATDVVVLRDGVVTMDGPVEDFTKAMLVKGLMPDNMEVSSHGRAEGCEVDYSQGPVLRLEALSGYGFNEVSLAVYPGEILGLAGVVGSGRTELAEAIFGKGDILSGKVYLEETQLNGKDTQVIIEAGLNYVPEDRHLNGIFGMADLKLNTTACVIDRDNRFFMKRKKEAALTQTYIKDFRIKATGDRDKIKDLSGGNQQKVVIARMLASQPKVIILDEPTRGIDAGARGDVYKIIQELKAKGMGILLISSDFEEISELADRVEVMYQGRNTGSLVKADIDLDRLTQAAFGLS